MKNPFHVLHENFPRIWSLVVLPFLIAITLILAPMVFLYEIVCGFVEVLKKVSKDAAKELKRPWYCWFASLIYGKKIFSHRKLKKEKVQNTTCDKDDSMV